MIEEEENWQSESALQAACFTWAWNQYPFLRRLFFKVDNGARKNVIRAMADRAEGIVSGIPDMVFMKPGFGVEFKIKNRKQNPDQKRVQQVWEENGIRYYVVRGLAEFKDVLKKEIKIDG